VSTCSQWRRYARARQVKWPGWKIHRSGSALPCFASVIVRTENKNVTISGGFICFILTVKVKQSAALAACVLWAATKKWSWMHPVTWLFAIEMTWLPWCSGAATACRPSFVLDNANVYEIPQHIFAHCLSGCRCRRYFLLLIQSHLDVVTHRAD